MRTKEIYIQKGIYIERHTHEQIYKETYNIYGSYINTDNIK